MENIFFTLTSFSFAVKSMYFKSLDASQQLLISFAYFGLVLIEGYLNICCELNHKKMNWYISQDIIAIVDHSRGVFKKGDVFTIRALKMPTCGCPIILIHIGRVMPFNHIGYNESCANCGYSFRTHDPVEWFFESCFAPLDSLVDISELTEHLETTKPFEL
jgi:hypothetical protein